MPPRLMEESDNASRDRLEQVAGLWSACSCLQLWCSQHNSAPLIVSLNGHKVLMAGITCLWRHCFQSPTLFQPLPLVLHAMPICLLALEACVLLVPDCKLQLYQSTTWLSGMAQSLRHPLQQSLRCPSSLPREALPLLQQALRFLVSLTNDNSMLTQQAAATGLLQLGLMAFEKDDGPSPGLSWASPDHLDMLLLSIGLLMNIVEGTPSIIAQLPSELLHNVACCFLHHEAAGEVPPPSEDASDDQAAGLTTTATAAQTQAMEHAVVSAYVALLWGLLLADASSDPARNEAVTQSRRLLPGGTFLGPAAAVVALMEFHMNVELFTPSSHASMLHVLEIFKGLDGGAESSPAGE